MKTAFFSILTSLIVFYPTSTKSQEVLPINTNKVCSSIVNIPYASDNFSNDEWEKFKNCREFMKSFIQYD